VLAAGLKAGPPRTIGSETRLRRELTTVAERGWSLDSGRVPAGVCCIGAPIFGPGNEVVAAFSITGPTTVVQAYRTGPPCDWPPWQLRRPTRLAHDSPIPSGQ